jgi:hypothetical protein
MRRYHPLLWRGQGEALSFCSKNKNENHFAKQKQK